MNRLKNIFKCVKKVIVVSFLLILTITVIFILISKINGEVPSVFGYSILRVSSGSMSPELEIGDVILSKDVEHPEELKLNDIVTYYGDEETDGLLITHKVIKTMYINQNGQKVIQTKGTANNVPDDEIGVNKIKSVMICKISFLNDLYNLFLSPLGLIIFIGLILLVFVDEIINIVKILTGTDEIESKKDINEIIDNIKNEEQQSNEQNVK